MSQTFAAHVEDVRDLPARTLEQQQNPVSEVLLQGDTLSARYETLTAEKPTVGQNFTITVDLVP